MALVAAHVTREQVFTFFWPINPSFHQQHRQRASEHQRRQSESRSALASRAGAGEAPQPAAPPVRTGAALAAPSRQPTLTGPPLRLRPPASTLRLRRSAAAGGAASPPPLCAPRRRGRRLLPLFLTSSASQPGAGLPGARLLTGEPPALLPCKFGSDR